VFDEQRELAAKMLNEQLPALPSKAGKKHAMPLLGLRIQPLPKPQPLMPSGQTLDGSKAPAATAQRPVSAAGGGAKARSIVLGHADKRFVLEDVESLPKQLKEAPSFRFPFE
jgi:hypothetical protein